MTDNSCGAHCAGLCTRDRLAQVLASDRGLLHWRAMRSLNDTGLAEHAVQETLLRAWRACREFDSRKGSVRTWLLGHDCCDCSNSGRSASQSAREAWSTRPRDAT